MIDTIIIDDEPRSVEAIDYILNREFPKLRVVDRIDRADLAVRRMSKHKPRLVFLDIDLSHPSIDGLEIARRTQHLGHRLIMYTAHDECAYKAFQVGAMGYLLKPLDIELMVQAVNRAVQSIETNNPRMRIPFHPQLMGPKRRLPIPTGDGVFYIKMSDILYIEGQGNYSYVYTLQQKMLVSKQIGILQRQLSQGDFFRIHESYLINREFVHKFNRIDGGTIQMQNGIQLPVSRNKRMAFKDWMESDADFDYFE